MSDLVRQLCGAEQEPVPSAGVITDLRRQITEIDEEFISGVIVRITELWVEEGENLLSVFLIWKRKGKRKRDDRVDLKFWCSSV